MNSYYSNVYWHFTGSPEGIDWHSVRSPNEIIKNGPPKNDNEAWAIFQKIIESEVLLAKSTELIIQGVSTDEFCCVTDIPIQNLHEHCKYYGNVCIGFHPVPIHACFCPVLYISPNSLPAIAIYPNEEEMEKHYVPEEIHNWNYTTSGKTKFDLGRLDKAFINHIKITRFSPEPGESFYREREWRRITNFYFKMSDIACVIVPRSYVHKTYKVLNSKNAYDIPVIPWELLREI